MSLENEDESSAMEASELIIESEKKPRISYSRDFLLKVGELEICKKLPSGFDQSILSEFQDNSIQERPRNHGNLPLQGFRRNDYSASPPTRGDSSNFSRGVYGRWDNRSSNWSDKDKDGDSQSDLDPDSGRRSFVNQGRRSWQNSEHDGLLGSGSGSFARFAGASKNQLSKSNEAYQPPRPFKAVTQTRTNTHDSFNDETFGSSETTSNDRAEEEKKRRASFELMRKEQQKVLQKSSGNKLKSDGFTDLILEETKEEGILEVSGEVNPNDGSAKSSIISKPRPLVPPGFRSTMLEKTSSAKPIPLTDKEGIEESLKGNGTLDKNIKQGDHHIPKISGFPQVNDGETFDLMTNKVILGNTILGNSSEDNTTSLLGKIFGSAPPIKDGGFLEQQKSKPDEPHVQSSRFAQWFNEDEKKPVDDLSANRPNDLLSLIVGGGGDKANEPELGFKGFGGITKMASDSKHLGAPPPVPAAAVLTCEDLEQTILSETSLQAPPGVGGWNEEKVVVDPTPVDNHATHHLLSLLQKDNIKSSSVEEAKKEKEKEKEVVVNKKEEAKNLSLEALFGSAFMKELQSAQAPVSAQTPNHEAIYEKQKQKQADDNADAWLNLNGPRDPLHLPEEESLINPGDMAVLDHISEKLAALNTGFRGERSMPQDRFARGPYDTERQFNNNLVPPQASMSHNRRPMFHPMDPQMHHLMQRENPLNQQFPGNMGPRPFHHPDNRVTGFDVPPQMQMQMQMRMQGNNYPPQHMLPRPSPNNFMPFPHQQTNIGGLNMPLPVGEGSSGSNHPEALQRMIEMEMRAQSKQVRPVNAGPSQGMYGHGHELDMGFRYR